VNEPHKTDEGQGKPKLFKSKKELVMLGISAVVFVFVIYRMYLSKGSKGDPPVAELNPAAVTATPPATPAPAPTPAAAPAAAATAAAAATQAQANVAELLALAEMVEPEGPHRAEPPPKPTRDPFTMTRSMHDDIYVDERKAADDKAELKLITLAPDEVARGLAAVPGAERAAKEGLKLGAILLVGSWRGANINGRVVRCGDTVLGLTLLEVHSDHVLLKSGRHRIKLLMRRSHLLGGGRSPTEQRSRREQE